MSDDLGGFDLDEAVNSFMGAAEQPQRPAAKPVQIVNFPAAKPASPAPAASSYSEVQKRLDKAVCYQTLLEGGFFDDENMTAAAAEVEKEIQTFAKGRLEHLLGISGGAAPQSAAAKQFTDKEAAILKALAAEVVKRHNAKTKAAVQPVSVAVAVEPPPAVEIQKATPPTLKRKRGRPPKQPSEDPAPVSRQANAPAGPKPSDGVIRMRQRPDGTPEAVVDAMRPVILNEPAKDGSLQVALIPATKKVGYQPGTNPLPMPNNATHTELVARLDREAQINEQKVFTVQATGQSVAENPLYHNR